MRLCFMVMLFFLIAAGPDARAAGFDNNGRLTVDLADKSVNISMGFTGARLSLFGMKKEPGDVAVVVTGPERRMVVRRKEQAMGLWVNGEAVYFRGVPAYYDLALSKPAHAIAAAPLLASHGVGLDSLDFEVLDREDPATVEHFREALIRNKQSQGYFPLEPKKLVFLNDSFFRADFDMPANVPTGNYEVKTYLFRDGAVLDVNETQLRVAQVGFSAALYRFSYLHGLLYGLCGVLLAMVSGGAAHLFLRKE